MSESANLSIPKLEYVLASIEHVNLIASYMTATSMGVPGWGDGGQALYYISEETAPGDMISEHRFYEEEVMARLRSAIPGKVGTTCLADALNSLPDAFNPVAPPRTESGHDAVRLKLIEGQIALDGLVRAGLVGLDEVDEGDIIVSLSVQATASYFRADIKNSYDRKVYDLLEGVSIPDASKVERRFPLDSSEAWWNALGVELATKGLPRLTI